MAKEKDEIVELPDYAPFGEYRPNFGDSTINLGFGSGIEDRYGFGALYDNDFIDTEMGYDPFTFAERIEGPPSTISPFDSEDSKDTFDMSKFKAPETEEEKQGLLSKIGEALSKIPANILNSSRCLGLIKVSIVQPLLTLSGKTS